MSAADLLAQLASLGVDIVVEDGRLRVSAARGQLTAELKAAIASQKADLVAILGGKKAEEHVARVPREGPLPLSFFQERLWVHSRFQPKNTAYNMVSQWASAAPTDAARVAVALRGVVERHELLRAVFRENGGIPYVALVASREVPIHVRDLTDKPQAAQHAAIMADCEKATRTPFDLGGEPPIRITVYQVVGGHVVTVVAAHHIAVDAWSFMMLGREIEAAYEGREVEAGPLDYVDFAAWQRQAQSDRAIAGELAWWKSRLAGVPRTSTLPADRPRGREPSGATRPFEFDRDLSGGIRGLVREERATVYMALLAACAIVLRGYTGQDDIALGSPMGSRERPEFEKIIGPFVSLLVLRLDLSGDPTFAELLARARSVVLDAHEHRQVPFEKIVEHVNPARSVEHSPLFQVAVVQQNAGAGPAIASGGALFDLTWFVREADGVFTGGFEYRSDCYSPELIDQVALHLESILRRGVEDRRRRVSELTPTEARDARLGDAGRDGPVSARMDAATFFRRVVGGAGLLELPVDRPRSPRRTMARAIESTPLPASAVGALRETARQHGAASHAGLLAALAVLLFRHTGQTDVSVSVNHSRPDAPPKSTRSPTYEAYPPRPLPLPVRVRLTPDWPFSRVVQVTGEALAEIEARPESLAELEAALVRTRLELEVPAPPVRFALAGAGTTAPSSGPESSRGPRVEDACELLFTVSEGEHGAMLAIDYDCTIFDPATVRRMAGHYRAMLAALANDPDLRVSRVPMLGSAERAEVLARARATCGDRPVETPVIRLFEQQVQRTPDATAVIDEATALSYRSLDRAANALAKRLQALGVGPGRHVAVSLERSAAVVVSLLAILRLGAAYVPVDPHYPPERGVYVLEDVRPVVFLTEDALRGRMPVPNEVAILSVDPQAVAHDQADAPAAAEPDPDAIAYVLFTSGSTGRPKGVEVPNRALSNFLASMQHTPGLSPEDRLLSVTTISFDIAGLEIFLPLVTGASVEIVPREVAMDGARLARLIEHSGATVMQATPSTWRLLVEAGWLGSSHLKILCGGEAMSRELANQLLARAGSVWNMYGPTETTVWSTVHRVRKEDGIVPVGTPVDHTPVYVLDAHGELVPFGVTGEIYIGGVGVARGYLRRAELTASRFLADPFAGGQARMYRTGDAGRLRADGTFVCLGRLDHQVKIRGHRIELGEIEAVMREHPLVAGAVVVAREFAPGDVRLVGYYVARGPGLGARELRELCQRKLPKEVVPAHWTPIASIPLTPNGKTDTKALPPPDAGADEDRGERVLPRDALEATILAIWEAVLETRIASVKERFFDVGGHSLLAVRLFARIEQETGVALPLAALVEDGTIEHLANCIRAQRDRARAQLQSERPLSYLVPIRASGSRAPLFCVHGAGGNVLNFRDIARYLSPDRPFYAVQAAGVDGMTRPMQTIEEMADKYLAELRSVQPQGPYYLSGYCGGGMIAYEIAQRLREMGEQVPLLVFIDLYRPGVIVVDSAHRRWARTLQQENLGVLVRKARAKVERDLGMATRNLRLLYHLTRGSRVPFDLRDHWLQVSFLQALDRYELRPYPGKITVLRAREVSPLVGDVPPDLGWAPFALEGVASHEIPGDHHSLTLEPNVQVLAAQLEACVRAAESELQPNSVSSMGLSRRGVAA